MGNTHQVSEPGLESELLKVVREIRGLEQHLVMLRSRDSANSRTLQEEIAPRLEERERQLEVLRATAQTQRGKQN